MEVPQVALQLTLDNVKSAMTKLRHQNQNNETTIRMTADDATQSGAAVKAVLQLQVTANTQAMEDLARVETTLGPFLKGDR